MALFKKNNFDEIGINCAPEAHKRNIPNNKPAFPTIMPLYGLQETPYDIQTPPFDLLITQKAWSMRLKKIRLNQCLEAFFSQLFNPNEHIGFCTIAWDYSGKSPYVYPSRQPQENILIPLAIQNSRELNLDVMLFPSRKIVGSLNLIILIFEHAGGKKAIAQLLHKIRTQVRESQLTKLIASVSKQPQLISGDIISKAVGDLTCTLNKLMKNNQCNCVNFFEGSYGTHQKIPATAEYFEQEIGSIELELQVN